MAIMDRSEVHTVYEDEERGHYQTGYLSMPLTRAEYGWVGWVTLSGRLEADVILYEQFDLEGDYVSPHLVLMESFWKGKGGGAKVQFGDALLAFELDLPI